MKWIVTYVCINLLNIGFSNSDQLVATIDLTNVNEDKIKVTIELPPIVESTVTYALPKIVPGTYSVYDFGRFVSDFEAFDDEGKLLPTQRLNDNEWLIEGAQKLKHITYWVDDTYDICRRQ